MAAAPLWKNLKRDHGDAARIEAARLLYVTHHLTRTGNPPVPFAELPDAKYADWLRRADRVLALA